MDKSNVLILAVAVIIISGISTVSLTYISNIVNDDILGTQVFTSEEEYLKNQGLSYIHIDRFNNIPENGNIIYYINKSEYNIDLIEFYSTGSSLPIEIRLLEQCQINNTNISSIRYYNQNRNKINNTNVSIYKANEIVNYKNNIFSDYAEGNKKIAGETKSNSEGFLLNKNKSYCVEIINLDGKDNDITINLEFDIKNLNKMNR